jgi:hypothetical protein
VSNREWPGNNLNILKKPDDWDMHDHLCEILHERGASESSVCEASVGIWGALVVMRQKLDLQILETEALRSKTKNLIEQIERQNEILKDFNKNVDRIQELEALLKVKGDHE